MVYKIGPNYTPKGVLNLVGLWEVGRSLFLERLSKAELEERRLAVIEYLDNRYGKSVFMGGRGQSWNRRNK